MKSVTSVSRIFMIDVQSKGLFKQQINLILHFVNITLNPGSPPKIKQYLFSNDMVNHHMQYKWMNDLESQAMTTSKYYKKTK